MTREAKMRRAKLVTSLNLLTGTLVLSYVWGVFGSTGVAAGYLRGRYVPSMGHCSQQLGFRKLGGLLLCLYYYLYSSPDPATIDHDYGTLAMGHLLAG